MDRHLSIGLLGSRGIPNRYGGYEEFAAVLGRRLVERGHEVSVYTVREHPLKNKYWKGIRRILIPNPETRVGTFGQFIYDLLSNLDSSKRNFDIVYHLGYTSDSIWYLIWAKQSIHIVNMDGLEWARSKYNIAVRRFLKFAEALATRRSKVLISDSHPIKEYLENKYKTPVKYLTYGADIPDHFSKLVPQNYNLTPGRYDLIVSRIIPDNNIETAIKAKIKSKDGIPLVIIGNNNRYKKKLIRQYRNERNVIFLDPVYEKNILNSLRRFCRFYIHGHSVGGTNPSLLEAMACGCKISAHRNAFNRAVLGKDALYFSSAAELSRILANNDVSEYNIRIKNNLEKIRRHYNWEIISSGYEKMFKEALDPS